MYKLKINLIPETAHLSSKLLENNIKAYTSKWLLSSKSPYFHQFTALQTFRKTNRISKV